MPALSPIKVHPGQLSGPLHCFDLHFDPSMGIRIPVSFQALPGFADWRSADTPWPFIQAWCRRDPPEWMSALPSGGAHGAQMSRQVRGRQPSALHPLGQRVSMSAVGRVGSDPVETLSIDTIDPRRS